MNIESRERRVRRGLAMRDMYLRKMPARHPSRDWYGAGYMVVSDGVAKLGATQRAYDATLEEVEAYVAELHVTVAA